MSARPLIKICGITNKKDAELAASLGVWALGFIFAKSPRGVTVDTVKEIVATLPPTLMKVGVFVNEEQAVIRTIVRECNLTIVQLHGDETPAYCTAIKSFAKTMKAFRIRDASSITAMDSYDTDFYLLDTYADDAYGGTGTTFNWDIARKAKERRSTIVLSGGLTPDNVAAAVTKVEPFAVDVASGVESSVGKKDETLLKRFVANVNTV
jgi:phosphoribosylanthranilate isomerase